MDVDEDVQPDVEENILYENISNSDDNDQTMNSEDEVQILDNNIDVLETGENNHLLTDNCESDILPNEEPNPSTSAIHENNSPICEVDSIAMEHEIMENDDHLHDPKEYSLAEDIEMEPSNASMKSTEDVYMCSEVKQFISANVENTNSVCLNEESNISMASEAEILRSNTVGSDDLDSIDEQEEVICTEGNIHPSIYDDDNALPAPTIEESMDEIHHNTEDSINFSSHCDTNVDKTKNIFDENSKSEPTSNVFMQNNNLSEETNLSISNETSHHSDNSEEANNESELQCSKLPKDSELPCIESQSSDVHYEDKCLKNMDERDNIESGYDGLKSVDTPTFSKLIEDKKISKNDLEIDHSHDVDEEIIDQAEEVVDKSYKYDDETLIVSSNIEEHDDDKKLINTENDNCNSSNAHDEILKENSNDLHHNNIEEVSKLCTNNEMTNVKINNEEEIAMKSLLVSLTYRCDADNKTISEKSEEVITLVDEQIDYLKDIQAEEKAKSPKYDEKTINVSSTSKNDQNVSVQYIELTDNEENNLDNDNSIKNRERETSAAAIDLCEDDEIGKLEKENDSKQIENQDEQNEYIIFEDIDGSSLQDIKNNDCSDTDVNVNHSDDIKVIDISKKQSGSNSLSKSFITDNDKCIELTDDDDVMELPNVDICETMKVTPIKIKLSLLNKSYSDKLEQNEAKNSQISRTSYHQSKSNKNISEMEITSSDYCKISDNDSMPNANALNEGKLFSSTNFSVPAAESLTNSKNNDENFVDLILEDELKNELENSPSGDILKSNVICIDNDQMNQEKCDSQNDPNKENEDTDSNSDAKSDLYIDISKFLINLHKKDADHENKDLYNDDESIEWNSDIGEEHMEGRESVENSVSDCEEIRSKSGSRNSEIADTSNSKITEEVNSKETEKPKKCLKSIEESTKDNFYEAESVDDEIVLTKEDNMENFSGSQKIKINSEIDVKSSSEKNDSLEVNISKEMEKNKADKQIVELKSSDMCKTVDKGLDKNSRSVVNSEDNSVMDMKNKNAKCLSSFKFIMDEDNNNKKEKKPIIAITTDGLAKTSSKKSLFIEVPGEDIEDGVFTRVVIIGEYFVSSYQKAWPKDVRVQPYFLYKEKISTDSLYSNIKDHPYLTNSKKTLVLFILGVHELAKYSMFKSLSCRATHQKLKIVREINYRSHSCLKYTSEMISLKRQLEAENTISCVFSYLPLVQFSKGVENVCSLSRKNCSTCICFYSCTKDSVNGIFAASQNALLNINRKIFYKNLNETKEKGIFEFLPYDVVFEKGFWMMSAEIQSENNIKLFTSLLNEYLFHNEAKVEKSLVLKGELCIMRNKLLGRNPFKILVIGDTWMKCIAEEWDVYKKIQPHFYCKDGLTLNDIENLILSVSGNDDILVITAIPSGELFNISHFSECNNHTPLQYPVPKKDLLDEPIKYAEHLSKKMDLFFLNIKKNRKRCKVVFLTCYPVYFNTCYKYLLEAHIASHASHVSTETLTEKYDLINFDAKLEKCFKKLNKQIINVNKDNNLLSCNVFSLVSKLASVEMFIFPIYIQRKCPPEKVCEKLQELFYRYIQTLFNMMTTKQAENSTNDSNLKEDKIFAKEEKKLSDVKISKSIKEKSTKKQDSTIAQKHSLMTCDKKIEKSHIKKYSSDLDKNIPEDRSSEKLHENKIARYPEKLHESKVARYPEKLQESKIARYPEKLQESKVSRYPEKFIENETFSRKNSSRYVDGSTSRSTNVMETELIYSIKSVSEDLREDSKRFDYRPPYYHKDRRSIPPHRSYNSERISPHFSARDSYSKRYTRSRSRDRRRTRSRSREGRRSRSRSRNRRRSRSRNRRSRKSRSRESGTTFSGRRYRSRSRSRSNSKSERQRRSTRKKRSRSVTPKNFNLKEPRSSMEKDAISSLWDIHVKECEMYRKTPEIHPDHDRVKRMWLDVMHSQGLNTYDPQILEHWREYWVKKMESVFHDSWQEKKEKCMNVLSSKSRRKESSPSSSTSSSTHLRSTSSSSDSNSYSKRSGKRRHKKKSKSKKKSKKKSKRETASKSKTKSSKGILDPSDLGLSVEELESRVNEFMMKSREPKMALAPPVRHSIAAAALSLIHPMALLSKEEPFKPTQKSSTDKERENLLEVTSILCQIADKFGALGKSLTSLHDEAIKCVQNKLNPLDCINEDAKMLLDLIGDKIKKILDGSDLNVVQRAIVQEAHDRLMPFLEAYDSKKGFGLDIESLAAATLGMQVSEIIGFIRADLTHRGHRDISNEDLMSIYLELKSHQVRLVNQKDIVTLPSFNTQSLMPSSMSTMRTGYSQMAGHSAASGSNQMFPTRASQIRSEFLSLSLQDKIKKFRQFHMLPFEEKSFLLSHLDELERTDKQLAGSLRIMISSKKP